MTYFSTFPVSRAAGYFFAAAVGALSGWILPKAEESNPAEPEHRTAQPEATVYPIDARRDLYIAEMASRSSDPSGRESQRLWSIAGDRNENTERAIAALDAARWRLDLPFASRWIPVSGKKDLIASRRLGELADSDPEGALARCLRIEPSLWQKKLLAELIQNNEGFAELYTAKIARSGGTAEEIELASFGMGCHLRRAATTFEKLAEESDWAPSISAVAVGWAQSEPDEAFRWLREAVGPAELEILVRDLATSNPRLAAKAIHHLGVVSTVRSSTVEHITHRLLREDVSTVCQMIAQLKELRGFTRVVEKVAAFLARSNLKASVEWASSLEKGPERDAGIAAATKLIHRRSLLEDFDAALLAAASIGEEPVRWRCLEIVSTRWADADSAGILAAIQNLDSLTAADRGRLIGLVKPLGGSENER